MFLRSPSCFLRYAAAIRDHSSCFIGGRGLARFEPAGRGIQSEHLRGWGNIQINYSAASPKNEGIFYRVTMVSCGIISPCRHVGKRCFPVCLSYLLLSVHTYITSWSAQRLSAPAVVFGGLFLLLIDVWTLLVGKKKDDLSWNTTVQFLIWCLCQGGNGQNCSHVKWRP